MVQVLQLLMHVVHIAGFWVVSGYMPLTQLLTHVCIVELVTFKYLKFVVVLQVKQKVEVVWQVKQFELQIEHLIRVVSIY